MARRVTIVSLLVMLTMAGFAAITTRAYACGFFTPCTSDASYQQQQEQETVAEQQNRLESSVSIPHLDTSLERINISKRLTLFSDENKISYIYLISFGKVMAFYTVKGKITSGSKRLTASERFVDPSGDGTATLYSTEAPELDGTYGHSSDYIFFWTTDGVYVQWNGEYMLADQPLKLTTQPELVREIK